MPYVKKTVTAGNYVFTEKHFAIRIGKKKIPRGPNIKKTSEQQQRINEYKKRRRLLWIFCTKSNSKLCYLQPTKNLNYTKNFLI